MSQKNFKYPLIIEGDWQSLLPALEKLGYNQEKTIGTSKVLVTNSTGQNGLLCSYPFGDAGLDYKWRTSRTKVDAANRDLVLALAAAVENEEAFKGEWFVFTAQSESDFTKGKLYQIHNDGLESCGSFIDDVGSVNGYCGSNGQHFRKATKEEIFEHFEGKTESKELLEEISDMLTSLSKKSFIVSEEPVEVTVPARVSFIKELYDETYSIEDLREALEEEFPTIFPPAPPVTFSVGETLLLFHDGTRKLMIIGSNGPEDGSNEIALLELSTGRVKSEPVQVDNTTKITEEEILEAGKAYGLTACNYAKFCTE